jgi:hypothetical protein
MPSQKPAAQPQHLIVLIQPMGRPWALASMANYTPPLLTTSFYLQMLNAKENEA